MKDKYNYICKLITSLKKVRTINTNIPENHDSFTNKDIRYFILTIIMNNGLLFEKKFSENDWYIDRNDFSSFCTWWGKDGSYCSITDEYEYDDDDTDWSYLDEELNPEELYKTPEFELTGDEYIPSIFKDENGNISGTKVMNQIRNKLLHNQFIDFSGDVRSGSITLEYKEGEIEMDDIDIYTILNAYLDAILNAKIIKQLLYVNDKLSDADYTDEEKKLPKEYDVSKINEIVSMFQFLYLMIFKYGKLASYSDIEEMILPFNEFLNSVEELDQHIISSISYPDFERAQIISLLSFIYVMSDLKKLDLETLDFSFLNIKKEYSKLNTDIVRHIRNCFAHGYHEYKDDNIIIRDYRDGVETFCALSSITDFIDFTLNQNILYKLYNIQNSENERMIV